VTYDSDSMEMFDNALNSPVGKFADFAWRRPITTNSAFTGMNKAKTR
jgi:hypothetical protein